MKNNKVLILLFIILLGVSVWRFILNNKEEKKEIQIDDIPNSILSDEKEIENIRLSDGREVQIVKNEVLVYMDEDVTKEEYDNIVTKCKEYGEIKGFDIDLRTMLVKVRDSVSEVEMMGEIKKLDGVRTTSVNKLFDVFETLK